VEAVLRRQRRAGVPAIVNVAWPDFFKAIGRQIGTQRWRTGSLSHLAPAALRGAVFCPAAFVKENFEFYGQTLTGATEMRPRWKRCVDFTDNQLGEALGKKFVEKTFGAEGKERTLKMVDALEKALGRTSRSCRG
jgi:putative endopeptidase